MISRPSDILWKAAKGQHVSNIVLKRANANATLGVLKLLAPIAALIHKKGKTLVSKPIHFTAVMEEESHLEEVAMRVKELEQVFDPPYDDMDLLTLIGHDDGECVTCDAYRKMARKARGD